MDGIAPLMREHGECHQDDATGSQADARHPAL